MFSDMSTVKKKKHAEKIYDFFFLNDRKKNSLFWRNFVNVCRFEDGRMWPE